MPPKCRAAPNAQRVVSARVSSLFRTGCGALRVVGETGDRGTPAWTA